MDQIEICLVTNKRNDKSFVFKSYDSSNRWNRFKEQLNNHCFYNQNLQQDWNTFGEDNFLFEIKEIITDKSTIDDVFNKIVLSINRTYNEKNFNNFLNKPLKYNIIKLKLQLDDNIGKEEFNASFKLKLTELNLDDSDGLEFKKDFLQKIESGEVNNTNFEEIFELLLNKFSENKKEKEREKEKLLLFNYLDELDNSDLKQFDLNSSDIDKIKLKIRQQIIDENIISKKEILNNFEEMSKELYNKELYTKNSYEILDNIINSNLFLNKLKSYNLSSKEKNEIENEINSLISKDMISHSEIETKIYDLLDKKILERENIKETLKYHVYSTIGDENLNIVFKNRLTTAYLHKHVAYEILIDSLNLIDAEKIKNKLELDSFINRSVKEKEKNDVLERLNKLSSKDLNSILKMNGVSVIKPSKSSKINKLIESVPPNIIRNNLRKLGFQLKIKHVKNPYILFCQECGSKVYYDDIFCHNCGVKL